MDEAAKGIMLAVKSFFPEPGHALAICGKGNNAGDVLAALMLLSNEGWEVSIKLVFPPDELSPLARKHYDELVEEEVLSEDPIEESPLVVLDGLLGIGASGAPREPIATAIRGVNALRDHFGATVFAADLPSGFDADTGVAGDPCVTADVTVAIGQLKRGLVADGASNHVGRLAFAELSDLASDVGEPGEAVTAPRIAPLLCPRPFDSHKGDWGRVGIVAGSRGMLGAARLASAAAMKSGAGLVTLFCREENFEALVASCIPEVMVRPIGDYTEVLDSGFDSLAVGPGLGRGHDDEVVALYRQFRGPAVFDADALNALGANPDLIRQPGGPRLFTPHPGEMERLMPGASKLTRVNAVSEFLKAYPVTLLLKGSRSIIIESDSPPYFNTTGNPGMGSGGMGDVLTGVTAALLARGISPLDAGRLGAWTCGRAAEISIFHDNEAPESLVASRVIDCLGRAFAEIRGSRI